MKVYNYMVITLGIMLMLELAGIGVTGLHDLLSNFGLGTGSISVTSSSFFNYLFASGTGILMLVAIGAGIVASFLTGGKSENYIILPLIFTHLTLLVSTWINIINYSFSNYPVWISSLIVLIFGPLTVGYVLSLVEFFRGTD